MTTNGSFAQSQPAATAAGDGLRDIKPPLDIASGWAWLWWSMAAAAAVALLFLAWRYWRRRAASAGVVPPVPAHVRARQRLEEALALLGQPKPFCILVSDTLRGYLEERFEFRAPERTTEEFLHELQGSPQLLSGQKESLGGFLERCDLVKFAKYEPREPELLDLHAAALRLVEETEPAAAQPEEALDHAPR